MDLMRILNGFTEAAPRSTLPRAGTS